MAGVVRLETEVRQRAPGAYAARLDAVLDDDSRVVLLDDRGWAVSPAWPRDPDPQRAATARTVVGPDEGEDERAYWDALAARLRAHGVAAAGADLAALPHDVVVR